MMNKLIILLLLSVAALSGISQEDYPSLGVSHEYVLERVNLLRQKGCRCNGKRMKPVQPLTWNDTLELSAYNHAKEMQTYDYFDHHSMSGEDIGERLDRLGYKWQYVGENLAIGQKTFDEAMKDWIESGSHCRMLMNPDMKEVAVAKYGKYWVQHFGKLMPPRTKRTKITYTEGQ
jgi:uncharacterized protein YkwD